MISLDKATLTVVDQTTFQLFTRETGSFSFIIENKTNADHWIEALRASVGATQDKKS